MTTASPDIEALLATYLLAHEDVEELVGSRIGGRHPRATSTPWIKITQFSEISLTKTLHVTQTDLQIECYGGDDVDEAQGEASLLARTVRAALNDMPAADHDNAVVSRVTFFGPRRVPDSDFGDPARERFILDASVTSHPTPAGS